MQEEHSLFNLLVLSLGNAALISLGIVLEPDSNSFQKDLNSAKYHISLLEMLQEKTKGNLSAEEEKMLTSLLYDLRLKFVEARK
jgi:hypothetical protein